MNLLVFAHRGEAQSFLKNLSFRSIDSSNDLYFSDTYGYLLLSREGLYPSLSRLSFVLGKIGEITDVMNYGLAGLCRPDRAEIGEIRSISTVYSLVDRNPEFRSFVSSDKKAELDCVSFNRRSIKSEDRDYIARFAPLVDRELWGIAWAACDFKKKFSSFKLISDYADSSTNCFDIQSRAKSCSDQMLSHFLEQHSQENQPPSTNNPTWHKHQEFYFSQSQKHQIQSHIQKLEKKLQLSADEVFNFVAQNVLKEKVNKKARANLWIHAALKILYPQRSVLLQKICSTLPASTDENLLSFHYDQDFEKCELQYRGTIRSKSDLRKILNSFESFNFENFEKIFEGNF